MDDTTLAQAVSSLLPFLSSCSSCYHIACFACWLGEPGEYMLHERHSPGPPCHPGASDCLAKVINSSHPLVYTCIHGHFPRSAPQGLPVALRNLYANMSQTADSVTPSAFLAALRQAFPQFAEMSRASGMKALAGGGYAQQGIYNQTAAKSSLY